MVYLQEKEGCAIALLDCSIVDVNVEDHFSLTPMHMACVRGCLPVVRKLEERGANIDAEDEHGRKPLQAAQTNGHTSVVNLIQSKDFSTSHKSQITVRGHPKISTFSQVYKPYARGGGGNTRCTLLIYNKC